MSETFQPGASPRGDQGLDAVDAPRSGDPDIQKVLDQISARQKAHEAKVRGLTHGDLAVVESEPLPIEEYHFSGKFLA